MEIIKITLGDKEISLKEAGKYINSHLVADCLFGGVAIQTPDGILQAEVRLRTD